MQAQNIVQSLIGKQIEMVIADKAYDSKKIRKAANEVNVCFPWPIK